uniref:JmjC domain-containing protein n=1 Tax=Panagrolaimus sp. ES5 TaxID=591445 RepID=A0AC34GA84_9BILA
KFDVPGLTSSSSFCGDFRTGSCLHQDPYCLNAVSLLFPQSANKYWLSFLPKYKKRFDDIFQQIPYYKCCTTPFSHKKFVIDIELIEALDFPFWIAEQKPGYLTYLGCGAYHQVQNAGINWMESVAFISYRWEVGAHRQPINCCQADKEFYQEDQWKPIRNYMIQEEEQMKTQWSNFGDEKISKKAEVMKIEVNQKAKLFELNQNLNNEGDDEVCKDKNGIDLSAFEFNIDPMFSRISKSEMEKDLPASDEENLLDRISEEKKSYENENELINEEEKFIFGYQNEMFEDNELLYQNQIFGQNEFNQEINKENQVFEQNESDEENKSDEENLYEAENEKLPGSKKIIQIRATILTSDDALPINLQEPVPPSKEIQSKLDKINKRIHKNQRQRQAPATKEYAAKRPPKKGPRKPDIKHRKKVLDAIQHSKNETKAAKIIFERTSKAN